MVKRWRTWSANCTRFCTCRCKLLVQMMCNMYMFCPGDVWKKWNLYRVHYFFALSCVKDDYSAQINLSLYLYWKFCRLIQDVSKHIHCVFAKAIQWDDGGDAFRWCLKIYGGHCQACCAFSTLVAQIKSTSIYTTNGASRCNVHLDLHQQRCKSRCNLHLSLHKSDARECFNQEFEGVALGGFEGVKLTLLRGLDVIDLRWLESIELRGWILARQIAPSQFLRRGNFLVRLMPWAQNRFWMNFVRPRNPRTTPTRSMINIASAKLGVVHILPFSLIPTIRTPPPPPKKKRPDEEGLLWGWCVVGGPLFRYF